MMHPDTRVIDLDQNRGLGVFAVEFIPRGTLVWTPTGDDQYFSFEQVTALSQNEKEILAETAYLTNAGEYIVSHDNARYVNHSCDANSLSVAGLEVSIAVRDIQAGQEITEDYGLYYANGGFDNCLCGTPACRQKICKDDIRKHGDNWDQRIDSAFRLIPSIEQPLWKFVTLSLKSQIQDILANKTTFPSCRGLGCSVAQLEKAGELLWPTDNQQK